MLFFYVPYPIFVDYFNIMYYFPHLKDDSYVIGQIAHNTITI